MTIIVPSSHGHSFIVVAAAAPGSRLILQYCTSGCVGDPGNANEAHILHMKKVREFFEQAKVP